ncbi:DUF305 domain-containing protein [Bosea sp. LjRoot9]|uniref:DUF305 domain-containing protein n=1 Tax=Bosea sp. LjRoot9 TaxID=3342341 RepID=UPI003ECC76CB
MRRLLTLSFVALGLAATGAAAQDKMTMGADMSVLPQPCREALMKDMAMPKMGEGKMMDGKMAEGMDMSKMMGGAGMPGMDQMAMTEAQKASMQAMMKMHMPMMMTHHIKDPDLAFNCGMIVHHQGAIDMATIEIKFGADAASKTMAEGIIKAQKAEIAEMTARVETMKAK